MANIIMEVKRLDPFSDALCCTAFEKGHIICNALHQTGVKVITKRHEILHDPFFFWIRIFQRKRHQGLLLLFLSRTNRHHLDQLSPGKTVKFDSPRIWVAKALHTLKKVSKAAHPNPVTQQKSEPIYRSFLQSATSSWSGTGQHDANCRSRSNQSAGLPIKEIAPFEPGKSDRRSSDAVLYRQQPSPLLYSIDIRPARN